jgi:DegV family protein with EDD domain
MSRVALCTDSSALLSEAEAERLGVHVVPVAIALEGVPFDGSGRAVEELYERLLAGARATTSQPSPGELLDAYVRAAEAGAGEVLSLHLHAGLSGTVASARLAAREAPLPVCVVDTRTASFGVALCVRAAAAALAAGATAVEAARVARRLGVRLRNAFAVRAAPAGRVSATAGWTVLELRGAETRVLERCGDAAEAVAALADRVAAGRLRVRAAVGHAASPTEPYADALAETLAASRRVVSVERYRVGPAVGVHTGPLAFGAFWWASPR